METIPTSYASDKYPKTPEYKTRLFEIGAIQDIGYILSVHYLKESNKYQVTNISDNITQVSWVTEKDINKLLNRSINEIFHEHIATTVITLIERYKNIQLSYGVDNIMYISC